MTQGRPLFPVRPRFRVVHVNRARPLTLELQNVPEPLKLQRLWLLRLPAWEARRRIRKRLNRLDWRMPERYKERWRYYNQLLCSQAGILPWITHSQYQQKDQGDNEPGRFLVKGPSRVGRFGNTADACFVVLLWRRARPLPSAFGCCGP